MDTKMKSERPVLRYLFIFICLFIPFVQTSAVIFFVKKVCAYVRSELDKFNDFYGDNTPAEQHTDHAFIEYI